MVSLNGAYESTQKYIAITLQLLSLQGMEMWDACHGVGLRGTFLTCCKAAPLMIDTSLTASEGGGKNVQSRKATRPLIVLVSSFGGKSYTFNVAYGVGKARNFHLW